MSERTLTVLLIAAHVGCASGRERAARAPVSTTRTPPTAESTATPARPESAIDPSANDLPWDADLSPDALALIEALVAGGSTNCIHHAQLASHHGISPLRSAPERRLERLLWLVDRCPTRGQAHLLIYFSAPPAKLVERWEAQAKSHPESAEVLGNLAALLERTNSSRALELFERAEKLEPRNPRWPDSQARVLAEGLYADLDDTHFPRAYAKLVRAIELTAESERIYRQVDLADAALRAGYLDKAAGHANVMLAQVNKEPRNWNTGNLIYEAHATLGRVALQSGDVAGAKTHLLDAARTPGSPQLNSFGPNMTLASELLAKGEREVVLQYFDLVELFWEGHYGDLDVWRAEIRSGKTPKLRDY